MNTIKNPNLTPYAKKLRKEMTPEEKMLWYEFLKHIPVTIHRQKVIGPYIVDFYCAAAKLVIELDGAQHYEEAGMKKDQERDRFLSERGILVLRYSNLDIKHYFDAVCRDIARCIEERSGKSLDWIQ